MKKDPTLSPELQKEIAERNAVSMLMEQWVKDNVGEVAHALTNLVPFICGECNRANLQKSLNIVNLTFATVALDVIRSRNESEEEGNKRTPQSLPTDATEMQNAIYDLTRFLKMFSTLGGLLERNSDLPAFRMSIALFDQVDSI